MTERRKISSIMGCPRLMFTDNMTCISRELVSKGIPLTKSSGVFWGQCLTRLIENELKKDLDYILTVDYDSLFTYHDVLSLMFLLEQNPDFDAVFPVQIKREDGLLLIGIKPEDGKEDIEISKQYLLDNPIVPVDTGHFGLTLFRKSCFDNLAKPWFIPVTDNESRWGDDRIDEDVNFWHNFKRSGCKLGLATNVWIGHLQLVATFPDTLENDWKPVHIGINEYEKRSTACI